MPDVFLSYSREDQAIARRYAEALEREGFSVWWDQALTAGETFDKVTEQALRDARAVVVLWSKRSVQSDWVRSEASLAKARGTLVPVAIEPCDRPILFELTHTADLTGWHGETHDERWRGFVNGLRRSTGHATGMGATAASQDTIPPAGTASRGTVASANRRRSSLAWAAAAVAVLVMAGGAFWYFRDGGKAAGQGNASTAAGQASIAVLPFADMSPAKDQGYFADGMAEEILNSLARIPDPNLKVTSRNSSFVFRDATNLKEVGEKLDVEHVLEGSVRKDGEQLRITVQLINTKTDTHLWSQTYNRQLSEVFALQEDIARSVADALQIRLGVGKLGQAEGMTRDVGAYDAWLRARSLVNLYTPEAALEAVAFSEQAVARDPAFVLAWAELADAYGKTPLITGHDAADWNRKRDAAWAEVQRLAPESSLIKLRLQLNRAENWLAMGRIYREAFERGGPGKVWVMNNAGDAVDGRGSPMFLLGVGRHREAGELLEQLRARDPFSDSAPLWLTHVYGSRGDFTAALAEAERGIALNGNLRVLIQGVGLTQALATRDPARIRQWLNPAPIAASACANRIAAMLEQPDAARTCLRGILEDPSITITNLIVSANFLAYLGEHEMALAVLREAFRRGDRGLSTGTLWYSVMRDVRRLPASKDFLREAGLVDYWREFGWGDFCKPTTGDDFECD